MLNKLLLILLVVIALLPFNLARVLVVSEHAISSTQQHVKRVRSDIVIKAFLRPKPFNSIKKCLSCLSSGGFYQSPMINFLMRESYLFNKSHSKI